MGIKKKQAVTAVILTKDEAENIRRCLGSLNWCDDILIFDSSSDETVALARKLVPDKNLRIFYAPESKDFAALRNEALQLAKNNWILYLDADEEISRQLYEEIKFAIKKTETNGYYVSRKDFFLGKWLKYGETGKIKLLKLGRKSSGRWERRVHEVWKINGAIGTLKNPLLHYPHPTTLNFVSKINRWTSLDAQEFYAKGVRSSFIKIIMYPLAKFVYNFIVLRGFRDGYAGLVFSILMSLHSFLTRAKLYFINQKTAVV